MITKHIMVSGRVQGVGFRYFIKQSAEGLQIKGWVRNLYSGDVEIMVSGEKQALEDFITSIWSGNGFSRIEGVEIEQVDYQRFKHFEIIQSK